MKRVHNKAHKLYKTYSYNVANLNFMKQIHKIIKYPIYPNDGIFYKTSLYNVTYETYSFTVQGDLYII